MRTGTAICRICGTGYEYTGKWKKTRFCSSKCRSEALKKIYTCHGCKEEDKRYRMVRFKDGTLHCQQYCIQCLEATWISRWEAYDRGLIPRPELRDESIMDELRDEW